MHSCFLCDQYIPNSITSYGHRAPQVDNQYLRASSLTLQRDPQMDYIECGKLDQIE